MGDNRIRVRANRSLGELEVEGPADAVSQWWDRLWPEISPALQGRVQAPNSGGALAAPNSSPEIFGEYFTGFRSDVTDVDKVLIAGAFVQGREEERAFTTKAANQALIDQNVKVTNASENVRRLIQSKRVFVVSAGKYRVSSGGFEYLNSLKIVG